MLFYYSFKIPGGLSIITIVKIALKFVYQAAFFVELSLYLLEQVCTSLEMKIILVFTSLYGFLVSSFFFNYV